VATALWAWTGTRWLDVTFPAQIVAAQALVPLAAVPTAGLLLASLPARRWITALAMVALLGLHATLSGPWWIGQPPAADGPELTVLATNLQYGWGDTATVMAAVAEHEVDVLVLLEVTADARQALVEAGLERELPHHLGTPREGADGTMIYSRHPLDRGELPEVPELALQAVAGRVLAPGAPPLVVLAAHPVPPWPVDTAHWRADLDVLDDWLEELPDGTPLVVAGDLNGSTDHPAVRDLMGERLVDAHEAVGAGRPSTWPHEAANLPPLVQLDHVLAAGPQPVAAGSQRVPGSDHDLVWARLAWPIGPPADD
jgi:endonuclease/exonuclease/phosphatase (EEP) superfamily protein YafD